MAHYRRSSAAGGTFFFTVNLADRTSRLLVDEIDRLRRAFELARTRYPYRTLAYCVLPDHLHVVWRLPDGDADFSLRWSVIKRAFSSGLPAAGTRSVSKLAKREKSLWQRRFWEHQIRNETDLQRHIDYIHFNPVKHGHVKHVTDWPYSSFHTYVGRGVLPSNWAGVDADGEAHGFGEGE
jgi:putative transposase